ncbi:SseB family protein [Inquilinus sp. KBS0705]|nr:SseB family protein [Inquilinus sp. KBS0705]
MSFFKSPFNNKPEDKPEPKAKNENLLALISLWYLKPTDDSYKNVVFELMDGKATLLLPSNNNTNQTHQWQTADEKTHLKLTSVSVVDGLKVLGAFTDEQALLNWANEPSSYTEMLSDDVLLLCERNSISRVVINSNSYNMFVLERSRKSVKPNTITQDTLVRIGTAERQLQKSVHNKLKIAFSNSDIVEEAYQYDNEINGETKLVIGVKLVAYTDEAKTAVVFMVQDALKGETTEQEVDVFFLEDDAWLQTVKKIPGALIYKGALE